MAMRTMEIDKYAITQWLFLRSCMKTFLKTVKPWRNNHPDNDYNRGWNDCLKQIKKNSDQYFNHFDETFKGK